MNQLGLPISLDSKMLLDNFLENKQLLDFIDQLYVDKTSAEIYVYGSPGHGKTHLLQGATLRSLSNQQNAHWSTAEPPEPEDHDCDPCCCDWGDDDNSQSWNGQCPVHGWNGGESDWFVVSTTCRSLSHFAFMPAACFALM